MVTRSNWLPALAVLIALAAAGGLGRLRLDSETTHLLPDVPRRDEIVETLDLHGAQPPVMLFFEDRGGAGPDEVARAADLAWDALSASPRVGARIGGVDPESQTAFAAALAPYVPLLLPLEDERALGPERWDEAGGRIATLLMMPMPPEERQAALADPFGTFAKVLGGTTRTPGGRGIHLHRGRFFNEDEVASFFAVRGRGDEPVAALVAESEAIASRVREEVPAVDVTVTGPGAMAAAGERALREDLLSSLGWSALVQLLLLHVVYRHRYAPAWMLVPSLLAGASAVGLWAWFGWPLHGMALGFACSILGLAVDFPLHVITSAQGFRARGLGASESFDAVAAHGTAPALCAATSAIGFSSLCFSSSPLLAQIGGLGALSIGFAWMLGAFALPRLLSALGWDPGVGTPERSTAGGDGPRPAASWLAVAFFVIVAPFAGRLVLDGDVRKLQVEDPPSERAAARFEDTFGKAALPALIVHNAPDLGAALDGAARSAQALAALPEGERPSAVTALSDLLPPPNTLKARCDALKAFDSATLAARAEESAAKNGLSPLAFEPFLRSLEATRTGPCTGTPTLPEEGQSEGLDELLRRYVRQGDGIASVVVLVDVPADWKALPESWTKAIAQASPDAFWVHFGSLADATGRGLAKELVALALLSAVLVFLLCAKVLGGARHAALALSTPALSLVGAAGLLGILGHPLLAVGLGALPLVIGLGDDDGIYVVSAMRHGEAAHPRLRRAVAMTTVTTIIGLVPLLLARSPALQSIGTVALVGLSFDVLVALWIIPLLARLWPGRKVGGG